MRALARALAALLLFACAGALAQSPRVVDIPTRPGVTQRFLHLAPPAPKGSLILFAGGHGGLRIDDRGEFGWGRGNFLVRSRELFVRQGYAVAVIDAPSDMAELGNARLTADHVTDVKAVLAWLRARTPGPAWLVGTSRGTQSAAWVAVHAPRAQGGPDGIVLTSTILTDHRSLPVPRMDLDRIAVPVLVVHHKDDACRACPYSEAPALVARLTGAPRRELVAFEGGTDRGDPCEARAYHGFNGIEAAVVERIAAWIGAG